MADSSPTTSSETPKSGDSPLLQTVLANQARGPDARGAVRPKRSTNYLLLAAYRATSIQELLALTDDQARELLAFLRWGEQHGPGKQVCPKCGTIDAHHWCPTPQRWKCRAKQCGHQFTVLQGTRLHGTKKSLQVLLVILFEFTESKDSMSARKLSGLHNLSYHTAYVLLMKVREGIAASMKAEPPLTGYIQADAAYFMKYVRPGNVGTGRSLAAKAERKNAGLNEDGSTKATVSEKMTALVVFVQDGPPGMRRYKVGVVKTENQVDLLTLGSQFCSRDAVLTTDGHSGYNFFSGMFVAHQVVDHKTEFATADGLHTNHAEGFFSRVRAAEAGAWHKMTLAHIEHYGWEFAWRQTMVERSNLAQLCDLLRRLLACGRAERFRDYWQKGKNAVPRAAEPGSRSKAQEVQKDTVPKKRGRPTADTVKPQVPEVPKRRYTRRSSLSKGAAAPPGAQGSAQPADSPGASPPAAAG